MHVTTVQQRYIVLYITPQLECWHEECKQLTGVALTERDGRVWSVRPACHLHGYAERDGKIGFSQHDEHTSVRRFLIESLQLQIDPHSIRVRKCSPNQANQYGYEPVNPFDVFADQRTVDACHIDDIAWICRWNDDQGQKECFVVWNYDLIEFRLYPVIDVKL